MTSAQVDAQIRSITNQLVTKYQAEKVIVFGSAAKGKMRQGSDLDFLVIKRDDRSFHQRLVDLYRLIEKDMAADFIVYTPSELTERVEMGDPFIKSILKNGRVLYG